VVQQVAEFMEDGFHFAVSEQAGLPPTGGVRLPQTSPRCGRNFAPSGRR